MSTAANARLSPVAAIRCCSTFWMATNPITRVISTIMTMMTGNEAYGRLSFPLGMGHYLTRHLAQLTCSSCCTTLNEWSKARPPRLTGHEGWPSLAPFVKGCTTTGAGQLCQVASKVVAHAYWEGQPKIGRASCRERV